VCCRVLQCVAVCFSVMHSTGRATATALQSCKIGVLQCVAACCSVLQCVAVCCSVLHSTGRATVTALQSHVKLLSSSVLQCVAVCCGVLQCVAVCCSVLQCVALCCGVLHSTGRATATALQLGIYWCYFESSEY